MKLISTFLKDLKLSLRSYYIYIEIIMALLIIAVLLFVVPDNMSSGYRLLVHLDIENAEISQVVEQFMSKNDSSMIDEQIFADLDISKLAEEELEASESEEPGVQTIELVDSVELLRTGMEEDRNTVGMVVSFNEETAKLAMEFVLQGYESEQMRNLLQAQFAAPMTALLPGYVDQTELTVLDEAAEKLPAKVNLLPVLLLLNSSFVGLFIIAAYIFMDKEEGTIRALTVTPLRIREYLLSKVGIMLLTGIVTGSMTVLAVAPRHVHYGHFLVLMISFNLFGSALGLLIGSFYDTLTKSMGSLYLVIIVLALASVSYFMPAFSPLVIRLLPSYPMLFAIRETLLKSPDIGYIYTWAGVFIAIGLVLFALAEWRYRKTITV
ncbi:MAG: ABC transporter permease [Clostridiaceae bacterium]|nr:ABC transporter permease [Clostridiaceae bacterium]